MKVNRNYRIQGKCKRCGNTIKRNPNNHLPHCISNPKYAYNKSKRRGVKFPNDPFGILELLRI